MLHPLSKAVILLQAETPPRTVSEPDYNTDSIQASQLSCVRTALSKNASQQQRLYAWLCTVLTENYLKGSVGDGGGGEGLLRVGDQQQHKVPDPRLVQNKPSKGKERVTPRHT